MASDGDGGRKKKITMIGMAVILVVAAVVGTIVTVRRHKHVVIDTRKAGGMKTLAAATTTVIILCKHTDFRKVCEDTLSKTGLKDPKELVKVNFNCAMDRIKEAIEKSLPVKEAAKDPMAANAVDTCRELLDTSIEDIKRSFDKVNIFDIAKLSQNIADLRVWLSGAVTFQETCLDGFVNTTGDSGAMMTKQLDLASKLTRNSLAIIDGLVELLGSLPLKKIGRDAPQQIPTSVGMPIEVNWKADLTISNPMSLRPDGSVPMEGAGVMPNLVITNPMGGGAMPNVMLSKPMQGSVLPNSMVSKPIQGAVVPNSLVSRPLEGGGGGVAMPNSMVSKPVEGGAAMLNSVDLNPTTTDEGTANAVDSKPMTGNRRMLDQSDDKDNSVHHSKMQIIGDTPNDNQIPTPDSKPMMSQEPNTPSWADGLRRSLINADPKTLKPNAVVAQDGSGNFKTITDAVNTAPQKQVQPFIILIKAGTYKEYVTIPRHVNNVVFLGEGPTKTKITGNKNFIDGVGTYQTATVAVNGDGFMAKDICFENSAGPQKHQAVALRVSADMTIFHNCIMDGFQDTLYTHSYRQFYRQCNISGTIDFIFGDAAAVFQDCKMIVRKPMDNQGCMVTAQGRKDQHSVGALVLDGCTITADSEFMKTAPMPKSYLGRPWKEYSRTIIMQSFIDKNIDPEGWAPWTDTFGQDTCYYVELNNKGPGADTARRVKWKGVKRMSMRQAIKFTPGKYLNGDMWIKGTGVPYDSGMMRI